jgi:trigger factor
LAGSNQIHHIEVNPLKVEVVNKNGCQREMSVEVDPESLKQDHLAVCSKYQRQARVPGFRQGKTPMSIILQRFKNEIREDFLEGAVQKHLLEALRSEKLEPLDHPHIHDLTYNEGEPLKFTAEFEVLPDLNLDNYRGLEIERIPVEVKEEEVDATIKAMQERMAQYVPVSGRAIQSGDFAVISYVGKFADPAKKDIEAKDVYCEVGSDNTLAEFSQNLLGAQAGDKRSFPVKYPDDFPNKELAGTEVQYEIEVQDIRQKQVPELNDEFAKDAGQYGSLEELRTKVREGITSNKEQAAQSAMQEKLVELIIQNNPFDVPAVMVRKQTENRLNDYVRSLISRGVHPKTLDIDWAEFQERQKELAVTDVKVALVLEHIARKEDIKVTEEELDEDISRRAQETRQAFEAVKSRLTKEGATDRIKDRIRNKKSLNLLLSLASVKDPQGMIVQP